MNWLKKLLLLLYLIVSIQSTYAVSCGQLTGVKRLACEKSAHKQQRQSAQSQVTLATNDHAYTANRYAPEDSTRSSSVPGKRQANKNTNKQKGAKKRTPYNRKIDAQASQIQPVSKNKEIQKKFDHSSLSAKAGTNDLATSGLSLVQTEVLANDDDVSVETVSPSHNSMLDTALAYEGGTGVGDDALYTLY